MNESILVDDVFVLLLVSVGVVLIGLRLSGRKGKSSNQLNDKQSNSSKQQPTLLSRDEMLSQPAYTKLTRQQVLGLLKHYCDIDMENGTSTESTCKLIDFWELKGGLGNSNYAVKTSDGMRLLKICEEKTVEECQVTTNKSG